MKKTLFLFPLLFLFISGCTKEDYWDFLPTDTYNGSLTGEEILFWTDTESRGIFAADIDGSDIRRLASYDAYGTASPSFLADHRVIAIKKGEFDPETMTTSKDDLVIINKGELTYLDVYLYENETINSVTGLKGVNSDKVAYITNYGDAIVIYSLTYMDGIGGVYEGDQTITGRPAALPDGRIAYIVSGNVKIIDFEGNTDSQVPLPDGAGSAVFALSNGRLLIAVINYINRNIKFFVSETGPAEPWTQVEGFPAAYTPTEPYRAFVGAQICEQDKLIYIHEDNFEEDNPFFSILVGDIDGTSVTDVNQIFSTKMARERITPTIGPSYWAFSYVYWHLYD